MVSIGLAYLFGGLCIGFLLHISILCSQDVDDWMQIVPYQCPMSSSTAIARLIADISSDLGLIILPLSAFWHRFKLQPMTHRLIQACFCASILTAACNVVLAALLFWHGNSKVTQERAETAPLAMVIPHLLASISLLVCNILVVVTSFYRLFRTEPVPKPIGDPHSTPTPLKSTNMAHVPGANSNSINMTSSSHQYFGN
ncbi:hypothetical protein CPB84DRAFT_1775945 [Gymnopilus junonius]|uniref:Uncharacterized protein n=1 Tax=Gymnopilus junonius TaxID=109634 RepID=A0A9P5NSJ3_GYMJU|nr:hypothetical protein CPB84DRAFT_1775945 [Gymnopilus junonius]